MDDLKIARALQRDILGPGHLVCPCGCILEVSGHFPREPWIYLDHRATRNVYCGMHTTHVTFGWVNKHTREWVEPDEFRFSWLRAKKDRTLSGALVVRVSRTHVVTETRDVIYHERRSNTAADTATKEKSWPPKMIELFKEKKHD